MGQFLLVFDEDIIGIDFLESLEKSLSGTPKRDKKNSPNSNKSKRRPRNRTRKLDD